MTYKALPKPLAGNKQIDEYLKAAQKGSSDYFIIPVNGQWLVRSVQHTETFPTEAAALAHVRQLGGVAIADSEGENPVDR